MHEEGYIALNKRLGVAPEPVTGPTYDAGSPASWGSIARVRRT